ncbi:hypothetical protein RHMOL_Rhmol10G0185100 [Rhododendron molle]|uniref:Uncharacterized protein n=1 Tax=Rhododendron molle TaxID=49168 RepID=A0ACC0M3U5_RHOML|nr:hypothetical protein RHMOL_Rhmol10G0185100 [Rhododendron molle]
MLFFRRLHCRVLPPLFTVCPPVTLLGVSAVWVAGFFVSGGWCTACSDVFGAAVAACGGGGGGSGNCLLFGGDSVFGVAQLAFGLVSWAGLGPFGLIHIWGVLGSVRTAYTVPKTYRYSCERENPQEEKGKEKKRITWIKSIAAGMLHSACIDENGSVFVFGERAVDKLGLGQAKNATRPSMIGQLPLSEEVACGGYHTCVITSSGELYTWGSNENGCLGTGCTDVSHLPERVQGPFLKHAVCQVSCGWKHTAAISGKNGLKAVDNLEFRVYTCNCLSSISNVQYCKK